MLAKPRQRRGCRLPGRDRHAKRAAHGAAQRLPAERIGSSLRGDEAGCAAPIRCPDDCADISRVLTPCRITMSCGAPAITSSREAAVARARATTPVGCLTGLIAAITCEVTPTTSTPERSSRSTSRGFASTIPSAIATTSRVTLLESASSIKCSPSRSRVPLASRLRAASRKRATSGLLRLEMRRTSAHYRRRGDVAVLPSQAR